MGIITSGCYTGSLTDGFSVKLEIQDATDATTIFSTFDGITCTIGTNIDVADLTLSVIADGAVDTFPYSNVEFGSEVAIVAQLTVDLSFSATMSGCEVKVGAADAVAPSSYTYNVASPQSWTTTAISELGANVLSSQQIVVTAVESFTIEGCSIALSMA